ncbi:LOW QUALITY PROTEIN: Hypothetical protein PHPALM_15843 [Phytophthora palmivora]|uniref:Peptidase A2 domain-containing protein n=1 Tax=Phytophthora palmivora TaxID=4796 RepID=A0A2P4XR53_9STRA|nr:LOW QUALITY PROTEIN: Hypothetical protein PHPALM_15843 [Phytophthora palmivora]
MVQSYQARRHVARDGGEDVKLGRSPVWKPKSTATVSSLRQIDEYARSSVMMALEISPGESRGYWKYHVPDKKFKQSKAMGKINNKKATLLFDSGAEVSILDATFARKVGCHIDENQTLECEGVGRSPYKIEGRTRLKITLAGSLRVSASISLMGQYVCPMKSAFRWLVGVLFTVTRTCVLEGSLLDRHWANGRDQATQSDI